MSGVSRKAQRPSIFISYSQKDRATAMALEKALQARGLPIWRDERSIRAAERWFDAIERGIRGSRGLIVIVTPASADSEWVTYEYAFAMGARIPVVAVIVNGASIPKPIQAFQIVKYSGARRVAERIDMDILSQARSAANQSASAPMLKAKFHEINGEIEQIGSGRTPSLCVDLWIEKAPRQTQSVAFEIPDLGFKNREWVIKRRKGKAGVMREFLTDDMNSWGDVEIWARGIGSGAGTWLIKSTLYKALSAYYGPRPAGEEIRRALKQIREN